MLYFFFSQDKWKYDGDYWNKLKDSNSLNLNNLFTNFDNQDAISPFAYSRKYDAFLVGMRSSNMNDNINWVEFLKSSGTSANLRDHIYENNIADRIFATKDDMLTLSNSSTVFEYVICKKISQVFIGNFF